MDQKDIKKRIKELEKSIKTITDGKNKIFFLVADSKGTPIGSLTYIYGIAYKLKEMGYDVNMLYAEKDFVGVGSWLGEKYAKLPHFNVTQDIINVSPEDILFIPELCSKIMPKMKELLCKKVAILENFDYMTELVPFGATWDTMGVFECITTSENLKQRLLEVFPSIRTHVVRPVIEPFFKEEKHKQLIVNLVTNDQQHINSVVKPFKWRYPSYSFVTFRYINGRPREEFAKYISEGEITVWIDTDTNFGYSALEAMACGNIVIGKIPENEPEWMTDSEGKLLDNGVWFYNLRDLPDLLAQVIHSVLHCEIPESLYEDGKKTASNYTNEKQDEDIKSVIIEKIIKNHKTELTMVCDSFKNNLNKNEE